MNDGKEAGVGRIKRNLIKIYFLGGKKVCFFPPRSKCSKMLFLVV